MIQFAEKYPNVENIVTLSRHLLGSHFLTLIPLDEGRVIILFNAFQKKTQKTPKKEIEKGLKLKQEYFQCKIRGGQS